MLNHWLICHNYTPRTMKLLRRILVSLRPSVRPSVPHLLSALYPVRPSVCPSLRPSVCPSRIPCLLCSTYSSGWIHFIFIHLIKQLQKVCRVQRFMQNFKIWIFDKFLKFVTLTLSCFDLGSDVNHWYGNHGAAGVSQNAGVSVLVSFKFAFLPDMFQIMSMSFSENPFRKLQKSASF